MQFTLKGKKKTPDPEVDTFSQSGQQISGGQHLPPKEWALMAPPHQQERVQEELVLLMLTHPSTK